MGAGQRWIDTLAAAGVPALLCTDADADLVIVSRTPALAALADSPSHHDDFTVVMDGLRLAVSAGRFGAPLMLPGAGTQTWHCVIQPVAAGSGSAEYVILVRLPTAQQLRDDAFFALVENLPDIVSRHDRNIRHLYVNPALDEVTAPLSAADFVGKDHRELGMPAHLVDMWQSDYRRVFATGESVEREFEFPTSQGPRHFLFRAVPEFAPDGSVRTVLNAARDITVLKELQRQLEMLAQTDPLTSLSNRRSFLDRLTRELARVHRGESVLSLLLLDVDDFKAVNDHFGHATGDRVLESIGAVLRQEIQLHDFAARVGGDEFCVGLVDANPARIRALKRTISHRLANLTDDTGRALRVTVSIGQVEASTDDRDVADLIGRVDELMYQQKPAAARSRRR
ncbi:GGDEF domain-containing protein [Mycobacterium sp. WMMD1722]|uniref:GGDEF domain-containing protein n=1 Tax=Mycobacterium sp. WMMD1722 TaxID=3404117 RepID=UPI003BF48653